MTSQLHQRLHCPPSGHHAQCGLRRLQLVQHRPRAATSGARSTATKASSTQEAGTRPLEVSQCMAAARAAETLRPAEERLVWDQFAAALATLDPALLPQPMDAAPSGAPSTPASGSVEADSGQMPISREAALDVLATRYVDEALLNALAATSTNTIEGGDYRQVVLLGDGMDSRPFRLPLPVGTLVFLIAPPEVHERAEAVLGGSGAATAVRVPRGCLLRRVPLALPATPDAPVVGFEAALAAAGYRADRLSVWALQGLHGAGLTTVQLRELLAEVTNAAAFHSLVVGELPGVADRRDADNLLAEAGLLGAVSAHGEQAGATSVESLDNQPQPSARWNVAAWGTPGGDAQQHGRWLFSAQQLRLSLAQMGILDDQTEAQVDEDFFGHFS